MKAQWIVLLAGILILSGCATSSQVQQMIDDNNQKIASEQLKPEFDRISERLADLETRLLELVSQVDALEKLSLRSSESVQSLSLALNKAQGDMGQISKKVADVKALVESQQDAIDASAAAVDAHKGALVDVFRKQLANLEAVIQQLEGKLDAEPEAPAKTE
jgi:chromosome segregation ATPase